MATKKKKPGLIARAARAAGLTEPARPPKTMPRRVVSGREAEAYAQAQKRREAFRKAKKESR